MFKSLQVQRASPKYYPLEKLVQPLPFLYIILHSINDLQCVWTEFVGSFREELFLIHNTIF